MGLIPFTRAINFSKRPPTVDGRNPAPPKKPWKDDPPGNTNEQCFPHGLKEVQDSVHPQPVGEPPLFVSTSTALQSWCARGASADALRRLPPAASAAVAGGLGAARRKGAAA